MYNWQKSEDVTEEVKNSNNVQRKLEQRQKDNRLDIPVIEEQFGGGRLLACISRPGRCDRADG